MRIACADGNLDDSVLRCGSRMGHLTLVDCWVDAQTSDLVVGEKTR